MPAHLVRLCAMLLCVTLLAAAPLRAQDAPVLAGNPESVVAALQAAGFRAQLSATQSGTPLINTGMAGRNVVVLFRACKDNKDCLSLMFMARFDQIEGLTYEDMNTFNLDSGMLISALNDKGQPLVKSVIITGREGIPLKTFNSFLIAWESALQRFEEKAKKS